MAFRGLNQGALTRFNSATSSEFLKSYEGFVLDDIQNSRTEPSAKTFAPSSMRCQRKSWFRLRGSEPDKIKNPDASLEFKAQLGTSVHTIVQERLKNHLGDNWVEVEDYIHIRNDDLKYFNDYSLNKNGYETQIELFDIPIRFSCDGILRLNGNYVLLEIKTVEFADFNNLTDIKNCHIDQIKTYGTLLQLSKILVMYIDRQYGQVKVYEHNLKTYEMNEVIDSIHNVLSMVDANLAPDRLDYSDYMCTNCEYKKKCKEWG